MGEPLPHAPGEGDDRDSGPSRASVAVALHYEQGHEDAPVVVASGRGAIAEQILGLAFASGVKVREDADLAEMLAAVDVGTEIPMEAYAAVAEILVYLYGANARAAAAHAGEAP